MSGGRRRLLVFVLAAGSAAAAAALPLWLRPSGRPPPENPAPPEPEPEDDKPLRGRLIRADGQPWPNARLQLRDEDRTFLAESATDGGFEFPASPRGAPRLSVRDTEGYLEMLIDATAPSGIDVRDPTGPPVSGRVIRPNSEPTGGLSVKLLPLAPPQMNIPYRILLSRTAQDGTFAFRHVPPGRYMATARCGEPIFAGGTGWVSAKSTIEVGADDLRDVTIRFDEGTVEGRVLDGETPVANAVLSIRDVRSQDPPFEHVEWHDSVVEGVALTDADGRFRIHGLSYGPKIVGTIADGYRKAADSLDLDARGARLEIRLIRD
ncbi:MAG: carboxypeptidase regulatory-like domain-containing protein [Planctomycetes bacterium]|nr:carboxypeptidase regulatory-like domain-containing protein [Planctomycetota bacterium]